MIGLVVNGKERELEEGVTVAGFLGQMGLDVRLVAIELNGEILKRDRYADTVLAEGDRMEVVRFVQGG